MTTYSGRHYALAADLGAAAEWPCAAPGCERPAHDWALTGPATSVGPHAGRSEARWSNFTDDYRPLCRSHHLMLDHGGDFESCPNGHDRATAGVKGTQCRTCHRDATRERARRRLADPEYRERRNARRRAVKTTRTSGSNGHPATTEGTV